MPLVGVSVLGGLNRTHARSTHLVSIQQGQGIVGWLTHSIVQAKVGQKGDGRCLNRCRKKKKIRANTIITTKILPGTQ